LYGYSLLLDIYAPSNTTSSSALPVKVFLYGENNSGGSISDPEYLGCNSAKDAIIVTVNCRLGPLGFLSLLSAGFSGNYGIQDQLLALQWIQNNIQFFSGDPKKVLRFGQSTGVTNTYILSTLLQALSLFSAAAAKSVAGLVFVRSNVFGMSLLALFLGMGFVL
jgi:carboxylesterase type B